VDIQAAVEVLRSDWLTTGPKVEEFEAVFADFVGTKEAVAVSSGTAALHAAMYAIGVAPGDEVIVSPMTFAASANCIVYQGGTPVFADVDPDTLLLDPAQVESGISARTRAIVAVDYAGQPCRYDALWTIADRHGLVLIADACHSLGGSYRERLVGSLADLNIFSFHPVKHITTGEGGMITTDSSHWARQMRIFRNHGISQLRNLRKWVLYRQGIARCYDVALADLPTVRPLAVRGDVSHARHLYVIRVDPDRRAEIFAALRAEGVGVNVHYVPVHLHPFYRRQFGTEPGLCPVAEAAYEQIISLPIFPRRSNEDVNSVIAAVRKVTGYGS
jgi:perosamine synthetase